MGLAATNAGAARTAAAATARVFARGAMIVCDLMRMVVSEKERARGV